MAKNKKGKGKGSQGNNVRKQPPQQPNTSGNSTSNNVTSNKQGGSTSPQNNASANNSGNPSSNQANAKTNAGNQTTANQPQTNNVSNNSANQPNNNNKSKSSTGNKPVNSKVSKVWRATAGTLPFVAEAALEQLNSTSPTKSSILPYEPLWDTVKDQGGFSGNTLEAVDAVFSPTNSKVWEGVKDTLGDLTYSVWSKGADLFSNDASLTNNVGATARDIVRNIITSQQYTTDYGGYLVPGYNLGKFGRDIGKSVLNNIWDSARDYETIRDYSYGNLGFDDYIGDSVVNAALSGLNNMLSRFGENRDFYQRGRYSLNEMLSTMAKDIKNAKDKSSPEYKEKVAKFEKFNNLAKFSDYYWATKKEMDASDLSKEDFLKSKNLTPEAFNAFEQNAYTVHNLGSNLALNESNGIKRSDYIPGNHNYSYIDYTGAVNEAKKGLSGDIIGDTSDTTKNTSNVTNNTSADTGKTVIDKSVDNTTGTGTNNTVNENTQSSLTPDYLTEFYKKFDKTYNYDPAKGRFNIWL